VNITVSGPSTALAYARALAAKAKGWADTAVFYIKAGVRTITRIPKAVANVALSALSTKAGYDAGFTIVGKAIGWAGRIASRVIRGAGRLLRKAAKAVTGVVRKVAPRIADKADQVIDTISATVSTAMTVIEVALIGVSSVVGTLVRSPLVKTATTRAAGIASGALAVHALTKGAAAARIVQLAPSAMTAVVWATNPWKLLLGVGLVMVGAVAFAAFRLGRASRPTPVDPEPHREQVRSAPQRTAPSRVKTVPSMPVPEQAMRDAAFVACEPSPLEPLVAQSELVSSNQEPSLADVAEAPTSQGSVGLDFADLQVAIGIDGSIEVRGIPADLPEDEQRRIAQIAADAAAQQLHQIVRRGRPIRSADRRHVTKAARAAVLAGFDRLAVAAA
jgi:hypothetical protein